MAKKVACHHCQGISEVGPRAMSIVCPHCNQRMVVEDFRIRSYYAVREFATCGDIVVEKKGHVVATIKSVNLTVNGRVQGHVSARGRVMIGKTGSLKGDIQAPRLVVENGAAVDGFLRIGCEATEPAVAQT